MAAVAVVLTVAAAVSMAVGVVPPEVAAAVLIAVVVRIVAAAAIVAPRLAVMLVAARTEVRTADILPVHIAAALRIAVATERAHQWRRVPRAVMQAAGIRLVMAGIVRR